MSENLMLNDQIVFVPIRIGVILSRVENKHLHEISINKLNIDSTWEINANVFEVSKKYSNATEKTNANIFEVSKNYTNAENFLRLWLGAKFSVFDSPALQPPPDS